MSQEFALREPRYYLEGQLPSAQVLANKVLLGGAVIGLGLWALVRLARLGEPEPAFGVEPVGELPEPEPRIPEWTPKVRL